MKNMKKILLVVLFASVLVIGTGCQKKGYKVGTYEGSAQDSYAGQDNTATAKIVINSKGKIESVYLDTTYTTKDGVKTTKKALGNDYKMKALNPSAAGEWMEQALALEKAVVEKGNLEFLKLNTDGVTDAVAGCTIKIGALEKAMQDALNKAK